MSQTLVQRLHALRESRFEVLPGKFLKLRRPAEVEMVDLRRGVGIDVLKKYVVGWEAFTEADLLGPAIGASSEVAFDAETFGAWIVDHVDEYAKVAEELQRLVLDHIKAKGEAAKN